MLKNKETLITANQKDLNSYAGEDKAMYDRLKVDKAKVQGMIDALEQLANLEDPLGVETFSI